MSLELLGASHVGFDFMDLAKGAAGILKGAGGLMSSSSDKKTDDKKKAEEEKKKLEEEKRRAEAKAKRNLIIGVGGGVLGAALLTMALRRNAVYVP